MGQRVISKNTLFYGDNLTILRDYLADETIDLIYLDPPFNSSRNYNVLYKDESGAEAESQIVVFEDTWHWNQGTEGQYRELAAVNDKLARLLETLVEVVGRNQMMAYLVMMAVRLVELHRVLKPTGSLYLHCDPTASHYLKMVLDMIFGVGNFRNEVIWCYGERGISKTSYNKKHDVILFYTKQQGKHTFNYKAIAEDYSERTLKKFKHIDENGRKFRIRGRNVPEAGKWRQKTDIPIEYESEYTYRQYLDESEGVLARDWFEMAFLNQAADERLGYPTQKPLALLERIIQASSNPGDVVLDPFCGCGTAVHAAHKLQRIWAGIDITPLATTLIKSRLYDAFKIEAKKDYDLIGEPTTLSDAQHLATQDRYQFQWWALGLLPARPYGGQGDSKQGKKGADKGIDGIITFQDSYDGIDKRIIVQVKSGKVASRDLRDLHGTVEREKNAVMGVFITLEPPSQKMEIEQMEIGYYHSVTLNRDYPKIQILTIEQLLAGAKLKIPGGMDTTLKHAQAEQVGLVKQNPLL
jgi:site-specific DNA-methyltransferase (adenine-specific)